MRELQASETAAVSGGELNRSVGFPSGVSCEGTLSDWRSAARGAWNLLAASPFTFPGVLMRLHFYRLSQK